VPPIETLAALAEIAELDFGQLQWLADARGLERRVGDERLRHTGTTGCRGATARRA
jgi:hypothetical protein